MDAHVCVCVCIISQGCQGVPEDDLTDFVHSGLAADLIVSVFKKLTSNQTYIKLHTLCSPNTSSSSILCWEMSFKYTIVSLEMQC